MSEVRQRWRVVFARDEEARYLSHLDAVTQWERAFRRGSIPVATTGGFNARPKLVFAAPLQLGMLAEHELADLFLDERLTSPALRTMLAAGMPAGYRVVDLHDVWIGAPALAPQLVAADYRMILFGVDGERLAAAATRLMAATKLERDRRREAKTISYDLRPLLIDLRAGDGRTTGDSWETGPKPDPNAGPAESSAAAPPADQAANAPAAAAGLWMRLRHSQERGSGRADEVVAALADELGFVAAMPSTDVEAEPAERGTVARDDQASASSRPPASMPSLEMVQAVRERLWLADELAC
jgi:radical SAM-linked protein